MSIITDLILLALLFSIGLHAEIWNQESQHFIKGKTYEFQYLSQVLSGLPKTSADFMGLQINSLVELYFESDSNVIMTLKNPELFESFSQIRTQSPDTFKNYFTKLKYVDSKIFNALLYPVRFQWNLKEKISGFKSLLSDETFSINIKRAIINMLNMKFNLNAVAWKQSGGSYVETNDEGIDGVCAANYVWLSYPYKTPRSNNKIARAISITKTKSSNRCKYSQGYDISNFVSADEVNGDTDYNRTFVSNLNVASMNITYWKSQRFFLWESKSTSSYSIEQNAPLDESVTTFVIQSMKYLRTNHIARQQPQQPMTTQLLRMNLTRRLGSLTDIQKNNNIWKLITKLGSFEENAAEELIQLLRLADYDYLRNIFASIKDRAPRVMKPYLNILSEVVTVPSTKFIINELLLKPKSDVSSDHKMANLFSPLSGLGGIIDIELIKLLMGTLTNSAFLNDKFRSVTLKSVLMTIGTLTGRYKSQNPSYNVLKSINFFTYVFMKTRCSLTEEERTLVVLKSLGNMGTMECLPTLTSTLIDKATPIIDRLQAVHSMRKLTRRDTRIELLLLTVFADVNDDVELRLAAAVDILLQHTQQSTLVAFVAHLTEEPITQVRAYLQDFIVKTSKLPTKNEKFKWLLTKLKIINYSADYSSFYSIPIGSGIASTSVIYCPDSNLPRSINLVLVDYKFGKLLMPLEINIRMKQSSSSSVWEIIKSSITVSYKMYNSDIAHWKINEKTLQEFGLNLFTDFSRFSNSKTIISLKYNIDFMVLGEVHIPTTFGLPYAAKLHGMMSLQLGIDVSQIMKRRNRSNITKITIEPNFLLEIKSSIGIGDSFIKSELNSRFHMSTPNPISFSLFLYDTKKSLSLGLRKPTVKMNVLKMSSVKTFKFTNEYSNTFKSYSMSPFYVSIDNLKKLRNKYFEFFFGRYIKLSYYNDAEKIRPDWLTLSWLSAGDRAFDFWIKKKSFFNSNEGHAKFLLRKKSVAKFDEIIFEINARLENNKRIYTLTVNQIREGNVLLTTSLFSLTYDGASRIEIMWPEKISYVEDAVQFYSSKPKIKFALFTGIIQLPFPTKFNKKEPLKILTYKKEYSYAFQGVVKNSKGRMLQSIEMYIIMDKESKEVRKEIIKIPNRYKEYDNVLSKCYEDINRGMSHSPSCFQSWSQLNEYNRFEVKVSWTSEGSSTARQIFNAFNGRATLSNYLISENLNTTADINSFRLIYAASPYFLPWAMITTTLSSVTSMHKVAPYTRDNIANKVLAKISSLPMVNSGYKTCQIMFDRRSSTAVKTFDGYLYNTKTLQVRPKENNAKRLVLVQDIKKSFQVSEIVTTTNRIVQIIGKGLPVIRLARRGNQLDLLINNKLSNATVLKLKNITVATIFQSHSSVYGTNLIYKLTFPIHKIRILTDLEEIIVIEVSTDYRSNLRGICGDMDGELINEFKNMNCFGSYVSPGSVFVKSDYLGKYGNASTDANIKQYLNLRKCASYTMLSLL